MADEEDDKEGRPQDRGQARRAAFLAAAREVFLRRGYRAASVNEVVRIAGGSLATLYQQFGNKEGLFHAFVLDQHARFTADMAPESVDHLELEDGLRAIGDRYLSNLLKPDTLAFYRLVVSEGMQFPEDARRDVSAGAGDVRKLVSDFLRARGGPADESARHPDMLLELWRSRYHMRAIIDGGPTPAEDELKRHIGQCIDVFLYGIRR